MLAENAKLLIQQTISINAKTDQVMAELIASLSKETDAVLMAMLAHTGWWDSCHRRIAGSDGHARIPAAPRGAE